MIYEINADISLNKLTNVYLELISYLTDNICGQQHYFIDINKFKRKQVQ